MKSIMFALLIAVPSSLFARPMDPQVTVLKLRQGQQLHVQISLPSEESKPTFLFLPGVNRSLLLSEPAAQALINEGYGVVGFNFSVQPFSLATLNEDERPAFYNQDISLQTLADETAAVAKALKEQHGLRNIIPVTLSYTGAVSPSLKGYSQIIDSVPMTSIAAFSPELVTYRNFLNAQALWMGFAGPAYVRNMLDLAYSQKWQQQVSAITAQFNLPSRPREMVDGYVRLSRASEDFEWPSRGDRAKRVFVLAGDEGKNIKGHQLKVLLARIDAGVSEPIVLVEESGHVIPADQPDIYAEILKKAAAGQLRPGLTVVKPSTNRWTHLTVEQTRVQLRQMLRDL